LINCKNLNEFALKSDDSFFRRGLNKTGFLIVQLFNSNINTRFSSKEIADLTNISIPTVNKKLKDIEKYINSEKIETGKKGRKKTVYWVTEKISDLHEFAQEKNLIGKKQNLKKQHDKERTAYRETVLMNKILKETKENDGEIPKKYWSVLEKINA
ncbi:MAG: hypothetical protein ACOCXG_05150, partial [Nanoarchaeota archaeon]